MRQDFTRAEKQNSVLKQGPEPPRSPEPLGQAAPTPCSSGEPGALFLLSMESSHRRLQGSLQQITFLDLELS